MKTEENLHKRVLYEEMTWEEVDEAIRKRAIAVIPVGILENNGPHLPVGANLYITEEVIRSAAQKVVPKVPIVIFPTLEYGNCTADRRYSEIVSIKPSVLGSFLSNLLLELDRKGFENILLVKCSSSNSYILPTVCQVKEENIGAEIFIVSPWAFIVEEREKHPYGIITAMLMYLKPELISWENLTKKEYLIRKIPKSYFMKIPAGEYFDTMFSGKLSAEGVIFISDKQNYPISDIREDSDKLTAQYGEELIKHKVNGFAEMLLEIYEKGFIKNMYLNQP